MRKKGGSFKDMLCLLKSKFFILTLISAVGFCFFDTPVPPVNHTLAQDAAEQTVISMVAPEEGVLVISKKPEIKCLFSVPFLRESLYIGIDQTDMTALAKVNENGFTLTPFQVLPPGNHKILVTFLYENNTVHTGEYQFHSRHSKRFEQAYTTNTISGVYTQVIGKLDDAKTNFRLEF